jgi:hypothetical protein
MAAYIVARLPEVTLPRPQDWRTFAEAVSLVLDRFLLLND